MRDLNWTYHKTRAICLHVVAHFSKHLICIVAVRHLNMSNALSSQQQCPSLLPLST